MAGVGDGGARFKSSVRFSSGAGGVGGVRDFSGEMRNNPLASRVLVGAVGEEEKGGAGEGGREVPDERTDSVKAADVALRAMSL